MKLVENGTTLRLSLVDTPGFGDAIDNNKWYGRGWGYSMQGLSRADLIQGVVRQGRGYSMPG